MANRGHVIAVDADTKLFEQGVRMGIIKPIDDADRTLTDLGKNRGPAELEQDIKDAQRATEKLGDEARQTRGRLTQMSDDSRRGMHDMQDKSREVGDEIRQNLGEGIANAARGDFSSLADTIGDTLGGITAGIGGIGFAAAGIVGAVGLGAVLGAIKQQQEAADELKRRMADAYQGAVDAGRDYLDTAQVIANMQDLINNPDRADELAKVQATQKATGVDLSTILRANAGDVDALNIVLGRTKEVVQAAHDAGKEANLVDLFGGGTDLQKLKGYWEGVGDAATQASDNAAASAQAADQLLRTAITNAGTATEEVDKFHNRLITLPDGRQIMIDAKTGQATLDLSRFKGDVDKYVPTRKTTKILADASAAHRALDDLHRKAQKPIRVGVDLYVASKDRRIQ